MIRIPAFVLLSFMFLDAPMDLMAQDPDTDSTEYYFDSTGVNQTGTVTITADRLKSTDVSVDDVLYRSTIQRTDAHDVAAVMYEVPAARVQVNSRGESNLYLRNAGERQVSLFFDGALLNVPWDNRIDLSLLPVTAIGGMLISKGAPSVLYGANTMGGAVNIVTRSLPAPGSITSLEADAGQNGVIGAGVTHLERWERFELFASGTFNERGSQALPEDAQLPYNQIGTDGRTNTDSRSLGLFVRGSYEPGEMDEIALSVNIVDAEKGVAPEGHVDSRVDRVRFWRYPDWRWGMVNLSWGVTSGDHDQWKFQGALWGTTFTQQIDQFSDSTYTARSDVQQDDDFVAGTRMVLSNHGEKNRISIGTTNILSIHEQVDSEVRDDGSLDSSPEQSYAQYTGSLGPEIQLELNQGLLLSAGISIDVMATLNSADKPKQEMFLEPGLTLSTEWTVQPGTDLTLSIGRKSRFPSMRELYGEALNRFLVNTELTPESAISLEIGADHRAGRSSIGITTFSQIVANTIDQRNVTVGNDRLRQRYNLPGSYVVGVELRGGIAPFSWLRTHGHLTWSHARTSEALENGSYYLSEKPEFTGTLTASARVGTTIRFDVELLHTGLAYTLDGENNFVPLDESNRINSRLSWLTHDLGPAQILEVYARINNIFDSSSLYQLGLPGHGREGRIGLKITL